MDVDNVVVVVATDDKFDDESEQNWKCPSKKMTTSVNTNTYVDHSNVLLPDAMMLPAVTHANFTERCKTTLNAAGFNTFNFFHRLIVTLNGTPNSA